MQTAGARILREDEQQDLSREAVLLQWERKIEESERPPTPAEDTTHDAPRRFSRGPVALAPVADRRTITITGQPTPPRRRHSLVESQLAQPDRIALWAFLLGLFLVVVAAGTAHA